jgi:hypothetical protein
MINAISGVSCAPSPMGTPFLVTLSKARLSDVATTTLLRFYVFNAGTARAAILARHCHVRRVVVLTTHRP